MGNIYRQTSELLRRDKFFYTSLSRLRTAGVESVILDDTQARDAIRHYSNYLNRILDSWFWGIRMTVGLSTVTNKRFLALPNQVPILKVESIVTIASSGDETELESGSYRVDWRQIELETVLSASIANVRLTGVFGHVEPIKYLEDMTLVKAVSNGDTTIELDTCTPGISTEGSDDSDDAIDENDVLIFYNSNQYELGRALVLSVDYTANKATVDKVYGLRASLPIGTTVRCYGGIPRIIEKALIQFVLDNRYPQGSSNLIRQIDDRTIVSEHVDNYSWSKDSSRMEPTGLTTDPYLNNALMDYCSPSSVFVV